MVVVTLQLLTGCAPPTTVIPADDAWADGTFAVSARLHDQNAPVDGRICTTDTPEELCIRTEDARAWVEDLEGETLLRIRRRDGQSTLSAIEMRQDVWLQAAIYSYGADFVQSYASTTGWDSETTGIVDLWVMDRTDPGLLGLPGATIDSPAGQVFTSDGGPLEPSTTTGGGPAWIVNLEPGEHTLTVSHPQGPCDRGVMGWPADTTDAIRVPVEAGTITSVWMACTPL